MSDICLLPEYTSAWRLACVRDPGPGPCLRAAGPGLSVRGTSRRSKARLRNDSCYSRRPRPFPLPLLRAIFVVCKYHTYIIIYTCILVIE